MKDSKELLADVRGLGITQAEVAKAMGLTQGTVSKLERGVTKDVRANAFVGLLKLHQKVIRPTQAESSIVASS